LLARNDPAFSGDEHPATGPGFHEARPRQVGASAGRGIRPDHEFPGQGTNTRQLILMASFPYATAVNPWIAPTDQPSEFFSVQTHAE
jgi:hypothetical protein